MKNVLIIMLMSGLSNLSAQVGIQTENPHTELDINGDMNVSGKIYTNGTDAVPGKSGGKNEAFTSSGNSGPVSWKEVKIPLGYEGGLYLTTLNVLSDKTGLSLQGTGFGIYNENENLSGNWTEIPALRNTITVDKPNNKVHLIFQTTAQINVSGTGSFACGIFVDDKLKGTRVDVVDGPAGSYNVFNLNARLDDVATGVHNIKVACRVRTVQPSTARVAIGMPVVPANLTGDMAQSSLNVYVLEAM